MSRFRCVLPLLSASAAACVEPGSAGIFETGDGGDSDISSGDSTDSAFGDSGPGDSGYDDTSSGGVTSEAVWYLTTGAIGTTVGYIVLSCDEAGGVRGWLFERALHGVDLLEGTILDGRFQGTVWISDVEHTLAGPAEMEDGLCPSRLNVEVVSMAGVKIWSLPAESTPGWPSGAGPRDVEQSACFIDILHGSSGTRLPALLAQSADGHLSGFIPDYYGFDGEVEGSSVTWTLTRDGEQETFSGVNNIDFATCTGDGRIEGFGYYDGEFSVLDLPTLDGTPDTLRFRVHTPPDGPGVAWLVAPIGG